MLKSEAETALRRRVDTVRMFRKCTIKWWVVMLSIHASYYGGSGLVSGAGHNNEGLVQASCSPLHWLPTFRIQGLNVKDFIQELTGPEDENTETSVTIYESVRRHIPENLYPHRHCCDILRFFDIMWNCSEVITPFFQRRRFASGYIARTEVFTSLMFEDAGLMACAEEQGIDRLNMWVARS
jgi:hypothetical protein